MGSGQTEGFVVLHRKVMKSWLWKLSSDDLKLAIACIVQANWQPSQWFDGQELIDLARGQFATSTAKLAKDCRVSPKKARGGLARLKSCEFLNLGTTKGKKYTVVTVRNYDQYQDKDGGEGKVQGKTRARRGQDEGKTRATGEQGNKGTREQGNKEHLSLGGSDGFDMGQIYAAYPKRVGKAAGLKKLKAKIRSAELYDVVLTAAQEMGRLWAGSELQYCPGFSVWVNQERWQDERQTGPTRAPARDLRNGGMTPDEIRETARKLRERGL